MKKLLLIVFLTFLYRLSFSQGLELIADPHYQKGFYVLNQNGNVAGNIHTNTGLDPAWSLAEWHSQSTVLDITPQVLPSGFYKWADNYKDFRFGPEGAEEYHIYFAMNADNEFNHVYRQSGQPWPHLLIEQRLSAPFSYSNHGPGSPSLDVATAFIFSIDAKLLYNQTIEEDGYNQSLHAAQFLIYFTIQNLNPSSSGYGKYVWLGIPVYDDRYQSVSGGVSYDEGTQTLINTIPYDSCANESTHSGNWEHIQVDLLPYALQALQYAWDHNYLTESQNLADYKIGGMNMGWEVPGRNICTMVTRNMSLRAFTNQTYYITQNAAVCYGSSYTFPDGYTANNITSTTTHDSHFQAVTGGDSTIHTIVEVNPVYDLNTSDEVCYGSSYTFPDGYTANNITSTTTHDSHFQSVTGCDSTIHTTVNVNLCNDAEFISQNIPQQVCENDTFHVSVRYRNSGSTTWTNTDNYYLGSQNPQDNLFWGLNRVNLPYDVAPGDTVSFSFDIVTPDTLGTFPMQWRMVQDSVEWFGDYSDNVDLEINNCITSNIEQKNQNIKIYPNPNAGQFVLQIDNLKQPTIVSILDITGKEIYNKKISNKEEKINIGSYPEGTYFLSIKNNNSVITRKIIILR